MQISKQINYFEISSLFLVAILINIPLDLINNQVSEIPEILSLKTYIFYLISPLVFLIINLVIYLFFKKILNREPVIILFIFAFIWAIVNGLFLPLIAYGSSDGFWILKSDTIRLRYQVGLKVFFIAWIIVLIKSKKIILKNLKKFFVIFLFINLSYTCVSFLLKENNNLIYKYISKENLPTFGKNNFIVISFDGINGSILEELISINDINSFKDFTLYPNYITTFPATMESISSELTHISDLKKIKNKDLIINKNKRIQKNVFTYGAYNKINTSNNKLPTGLMYKDKEYYVLKNMYELFIFPSFTRWMSDIGYNFFNNFTNNRYFVLYLKLITFDFKKNINSYEEPESFHRVDLYEFDEIFKKFEYNLDFETNHIHLFHLNFSHWPVKVNSHCVYIADIETRFGKIDANKENIKCVIKKMKFIVDTLKKNKIYDKTFIIFKSDHGAPKDYFKESDINAKEINNNDRWSLGRYNSFLMFKELSSNSDNLKIKKQEIGSKDTYKLICSYAPIKLDCNKANDNFTVYIPKYKTTFLNIEDFIELNFPKNQKLLDKLIEINVTK
jgi:hypothetical protein